MSLNKEQKRVRFFLGDDVRSENDKPMIFGLCPSDKVLINTPVEQVDPTSKKPIVIPGLAILTSFIGYSGPYKKAEASLYLPDGKAIFEHQALNTEGTKAAAEHKNDINLVVKFAPFSISQLGQYKFVIKLNEEIQEYKFMVERAFPFQKKS